LMRSHTTCPERTWTVQVSMSWCYSSSPGNTYQAPTYTEAAPPPPPTTPSLYRDLASFPCRTTQIKVPCIVQE
jgi:hypothetical protein